MISVRSWAAAVAAISASAVPSFLTSPAPCLGEQPAVVGGDAVVDRKSREMSFRKDERGEQPTRTDRAGHFGSVAV